MTPRPRMTPRAQAKTKSCTKVTYFVKHYSIISTMWTLIAKLLKILQRRLVVKLLIGNIFIETPGLNHNLIVQVQVTKTLFQTLKDHHQPH